MSRLYSAMKALVNKNTKTFNAQDYSSGVCLMLFVGWKLSSELCFTFVVMHVIFGILPSVDNTRDLTCDTER